MPQSAPRASRDRRPQSASGAEIIGMVLGLLCLPFLLILALAGAIPGSEVNSNYKFSRKADGTVKKWRR